MTGITAHSPYSPAHLLCVSSAGAIDVHGGCGMRPSRAASPIFQQRAASYGSRSTHSSPRYMRFLSSPMRLPSPLSSSLILASRSRTSRHIAPKPSLRLTPRYGPRRCASSRCTSTPSTMRYQRSSLGCVVLPSPISASHVASSRPTVAPRARHSLPSSRTSGANLQELALDGTGIGPAHLAATLAQTPKLERLAVHAVRGGPAVDDALLAALTVCDGLYGDGDGGVLCPYLHALVLHRIVICTDGALAAMLRSRRANEEVGEDVDVDNADVNGSTVVARLASVDIDLSPRFCATNACDAAYLSLCNSRGGVLSRTM